MAQIEWYAADSVYDPPSHAQGVKVTGAQTLLFIAGQVAFDEHGGPAHGRDFAAQAREVFRALRRRSRRAGRRCATSSSSPRTSPTSATARS